MADPASPSLLPAPAITPEKQQDAAAQGQQGIDAFLQDGLSIERPRSALHSGNFTPVELSPRVGGSGDAIGLDSESQFRPAQDRWVRISPPRDFAPFSFSQGAASYRREAFKSVGPSSLSSSLSSNFVYQPPTSPLVQSESNEELDLTLPLNSFNIDSSSPRNLRRHTLNFGGHSPFSNATNHRQPSLRRESIHPYQAHQPRRSLNSTPNLLFTGTSPQTPAPFRPRRPSLGSEASPLQHASMVGSYEESILRGRMSTTPSKPLEFMAQIGVLGLGKCKASLRCPTHVTLPFSAVFYNYATISSGRGRAEDGPSPYVGQIDLENGLPNPEEGQRAKRKLQSRYQDLKGVAEQTLSSHESPAEEGDDGPQAPRPKRSSRLSKAPPGGGYRIPEKGQLQIIIKNPNKTAVKLFLIPYDLAGMEPGTKTFIRQRSYSAGPIIEAEGPAPKDGPVPGEDRPTLRYLIHLHICCPSKGRHYLYKSIRVVFANRVPDGKERLRNEVTYPDPRFSPYKPIRVMHPPLAAAPAGNDNTISSGSASNSTATLTAERALRRRSAIFPSHSHRTHHLHHPYHQPQHHHHHPFQPSTPTRPSNNTESDDIPTMMMPDVQMTGPSASSFPTQTLTTTTNTAWPTTPTPAGATTLATSTYGKLARGDAGYGPQSAVAEGLLSKRLRSLGVVQSLPSSPPPPPPGAWPGAGPGPSPGAGTDGGAGD